MINARSSDQSGGAPVVGASTPSVAEGAVAGDLYRRADITVGSSQPLADKLLLPPSRGGRSWTWWLCWSAGWGGALSLSIIALLRMFYHDGTLLLTCINAFTLYAYLPAYLILVWAAWERQWTLLALCGAVIACHVVWVAPDFTPARVNTPVTEIDAAPRAIKIFSANVAAENEHRESFLKEVVRADADIVVFVEYRRWWHNSVMASPIVRTYRYGTGITDPYLGEIAIFSKLPISKTKRYWPTGRQICLVDVDVGNENLRLCCIHGPRPMNSSGNRYYDYWVEAFPLIAQQVGPLIVLGDFNATQHSKVFETITAGGLRSAHVDRGRASAVTWPNGVAPAPPIRIDHAFLSPEVECLAISEGDGEGSDHKPLALEVRVLSDSNGGQSARPAPSN